MTQQELADRVGVTRQTIVALEGEAYTPSLALALRVPKSLAKQPTRSSGSTSSQPLARRPLLRPAKTRAGKLANKLRAERQGWRQKSGRRAAAAHAIDRSQRSQNRQRIAAGRFERGRHLLARGDRSRGPKAGSDRARRAAASGPGARRSMPRLASRASGGQPNSLSGRRKNRMAAIVARGMAVKTSMFSIRVV